MTSDENSPSQNANKHYYISQFPLSIIRYDRRV